MKSANLAIGLRSNQLNCNLANTVVHPTPGKEMEYMALMKYPVLKLLCQQGFANEIGRLFQGICDIQGTNTCFFVNLKIIPKERKVTYEKLFATKNLTRNKRNVSGSQWEAKHWTTQATLQHPQQVSHHSKS
jgi:hypothetical protein